MNIQVERTRMKYSSAREKGNYCLFDIEFMLKTLAWEGNLWTLKGMSNLTKAEEILIEYYLNKYRENQVYEPVCASS